MLLFSGGLIRWTMTFLDIRGSGEYIQLIVHSWKQRSLRVESIPERGPCEGGESERGFFIPGTHAAADTVVLQTATAERERPATARNLRAQLTSRRTGAETP